MKIKILLISILISFCVVTTIIPYLNQSQDISAIQESVLRFHVRANSDTNADQELKLKVKEEVVKFLAPILQEAKNKEESKTLILNNIEKIKEKAINTLEQNHSDYKVEAYISKEYFPMKAYGDSVFPAGDYEALRIDIGKAEGKNWWCVMFPNLCFLDITHGEFSDEAKQSLKNVLTENEYNTVMQSKDVKVKFKFKIIEEIKSWF